MGRTTTWTCEKVLPAEVGSAAKARAFVTHQLVEHRLLYLVEEVRLVASELATNAVVHAGTEFTVTLEGRGQSVLLTVSDGSPASPAALDLDLATATSGRGLRIVNLVSQSWGVSGPDGDQKSVWALFQKRAGTFS